jgi:hypothetical protein
VEAALYLLDEEKVALGVLLPEDDMPDDFASRSGIDPMVISFICVKWIQTCPD